MGFDEQELVVLESMGESHWEALQYVEKYGLMPPQVDEAADLLEWGLIMEESDINVMTTALGDALLEEFQP